MLLIVKQGASELEMRLAKAESDLDLEKLRCQDLLEKLEKARKRGSTSALAMSSENLTDTDIL